MSTIFSVPGAKYLHIADDLVTGVVGGCLGHSNPIPDGPRPDTTYIRRDPQAGGVLDIFFPGITDIDVGMRVQAFWRGQRGWGFEVKTLDLNNKRVRISSSSGRTQQVQWIPLDRVWNVWSVSP